jgi:D-beta-D-heptose 7-phosphate kinase/D-beta-D-heptose 1-phosphate adenosyltransferase
MWLLSKDVEGELPASAREVADVTGAGDTVIATMAMAMAAGATVVEAARLANEAAGVAVGKFGAATVTPVELLRALEMSTTR